MIEREKLEKLAKVMGGEYVHPGAIRPGFARWYGEETVIMDCECGRMDEINPTFTAHEDGQYEPGTLESLYAKLDEWANGEEGCTFTRTLINGSYELCLYAYSWKQVNFEGSELSTLIDAVLWIAEQEQGGEA